MHQNTITSTDRILTVISPTDGGKEANRQDDEREKDVKNIDRVAVPVPSSTSVVFNVVQARYQEVKRRVGPVLNLITVWLFAEQRLANEKVGALLEKMEFDRT